MTKRILPAILLAALAAFSAETLEVQLQRAVQKEAATGDLKAAIDEYRKIADRAGSNHAVAAQALLHLGDAQQRQGAGQARATYERIVKKVRQRDGNGLRGTAATRLSRRCARWPLLWETACLCGLHQEHRFKTERRWRLAGFHRLE